MKKVKITVLKTTLDEELAREYGADGLGPGPRLRAGQVFYGDYAKPEGLCDEAWKAMYSMFLPWPMGRERAYFTMGTGLDGLVWPSAAATMGCGL